MNHNDAIEKREEIRRHLLTERGRGYLRDLLDPDAPIGKDLYDQRDRTNHFCAITGMAQGALHYVAGHARALIDAAAEALPLDHDLPPSILPTPAGFVWLDRPIVTFWTQPGLETKVEGISWNITTRETGQGVRVRGVGELQLNATVRPEDATNIIVGCWAKWPGPEKVSHPPVLMFCCSIEPNHSLAHLQSVDPDTSFLEALRFIVTFWLFVHQRVLVTTSRRVDRATARRLARTVPDLPRDPAVNVVVLRHADHVEGETKEHRTVEWRYQWLVRGHWRQQFYRSTGERRPIWILPYMKGPEDKPVKPPSETVFAVTR